MAKSTKKINLSEHTLTIKKCDLNLFDFSDIEEFVRNLCTSKDGFLEYEFNAIKDIMIYLWGGGYGNAEDLARQNWKLPNKWAIKERFGSEEMFLANLPLPDKISGVCHLATGTGKSFVIFAIAYLSIIMGKVNRVLVLGPSSTIIEAGLNDKIQEHIYGERGKELQNYLPAKYKNIPVNILNANKPIEDNSIIVENINAIFSWERNSLGDTLFSRTDEVLVLSDEVHHAYSHLKFDPSKKIALDKEYSDKEKDSERLWMQFLRGVGRFHRDENKIKRHIGFTGTPYNQNEFFSDVIVNYSIKDAIDDKIIKLPKILINKKDEENEGDFTTAQRFEWIIKNHLENVKNYSYPNNKGSRRVKPITIFVTNTQDGAKKGMDEFVKSLADYYADSLTEHKDRPRAELEEFARKKCICVISGIDTKEYKSDFENIEEIDPKKPGGQVEFIFAVNKLSEGWDVDNVFQIVPMEGRVFNSKLLISQVIGRGLRLPRKVPHAEILQNYPKVIITNHERFAQEIETMVDQVVDCELRLESAIGESDTRRKYNFNLFNIAYIPQTRTEIKEAKEKEKGLPTKLELEPYREKKEVRLTYSDASHQKLQLKKDFYTVDQVSVEIADRYSNQAFERERFNFGDGFSFDAVPSRKEIKEIIKKSMDNAEISDKLSAKNREQINIFFNSFLPQGGKKVIRENIEGDIFAIRTDGIQQTSARVGGLEDEISAFVSESYKEEVGKRNVLVLEYLEKEVKQRKLDENQESLFQKRSVFETSSDKVKPLINTKNVFEVNDSMFKTPQNMVLLSHEPERKFVFGLIENGKYLSAWVKSPDMNFYSLEYEFFKGGKDRIRRNFNPDFFIKLNIEEYINRLDGAPEQNVQRLRELQNEGKEEIILVVEIKSDAEKAGSDENSVLVAKKKAGEEHFEKLNNRLPNESPLNFDVESRSSLRSQRYIFKLLSPEDFDGFFSGIRNGKVI